MYAKASNGHIRHKKHGGRPLYRSASVSVVEDFKIALFFVHRDALRAIPVHSLDGLGIAWEGYVGLLLVVATAKAWHGVVQEVASGVVGFEAHHVGPYVHIYEDRVV